MKQFLFGFLKAILKWVGIPAFIWVGARMILTHFGVLPEVLDIMKELETLAPQFFLVELPNFLGGVLLVIWQMFSGLLVEIGEFLVDAYHWVVGLF